MKKYLYITGGWGYGNRGDNAILAAMIQSIKESNAFNASDLLITSFEADETKKHNDVDTIDSIHKILTSKRIKNLWHRFALWIWRKTEHKVLISSALSKHLDLLKNSKALLMGGGGYFNDDWPDMLNSKYAEIEMANSVQCPVIIYGQTVGPFTDRTINESLSGMLGKVTAIAYRDAQSESVLSKCGFDSLRSALTADEANLLNIFPNSFFGLHEGKMIIGLMIQNFRSHLGVSGKTGQNRIANSGQYHSEICAALNAVVADMACHLVFIPSTEWDVKSNKKVYDSIKLNDKSTKQYLDDLTTKDFIAASQQVDLMISTNMHPVILAATGGKPSVAISYHYKLDDYMKSIGLEEYVLRIDDFSAEELKNKIYSAIKNKATLEKTVELGHKEVKVLARKNLEMLNKFVINS